MKKARFKHMKKTIREEMLNKTFEVGSGGKVSREEWLAVHFFQESFLVVILSWSTISPYPHVAVLQAAKAKNESVLFFLQPYEPLLEIVNAAIEQIHRELANPGEIRQAA